MEKSTTHTKPRVSRWSEKMMSFCCCFVDKFVHLVNYVSWNGKKIRPTKYRDDVKWKSENLLMNHNRWELKSTSSIVHTLVNAMQWNDENLEGVLCSFNDIVHSFITRALFFSFLIFHLSNWKFHVWISSLYNTRWWFNIM